jgi:hypothetical protein
MRTAFFLLLPALSNAVSLSLAFEGAKPKKTVDEIYVAYNIDTGSLYNGMNFSDAKLRKLTSQLGPSIVRIGGTAVDASYYFPSTPYLVGQVNDCAVCESGASAIGEEMLSAIFDFISATDMSLLWDLNGEDARDGVGPWLPDFNWTAQAKFLNQRYPGVKYAYSVGNEPDLWKKKVTPEQLARDAVTLKDSLNSYDIGKDVYGSSFARIDPEVARAYLPIAAAGGVKGYTVHNYPDGGHQCNVSVYLDKTRVTTNMAHSLSNITLIAKDAAPEMLLVLEETAGSSGGGCDNVTDRFVAGFTWHLTLNTVANSGFDRVHRQDIAGWSFAFGKSNYMLVGPPGWVNGSSELLTPHADYYSSILWRMLIGRSLLSTTVEGDTSAFEGHIWCSSARFPGSLVLSWVNLAQEDAVLALPASLSSLARTLYTMTATAAPKTTFADLSSDDVFLNGEKMTILEDGSLPSYPIAGKAAGASSSFTARGWSYGFVLFAGSVPACN